MLEVHPVTPERWPDLAEFLTRIGPRGGTPQTDGCWCQFWRLRGNAHWDGQGAPNRVALEDPSPAARVRAYDWLATQDVEIPGYDPLGLPAARRAALRAWAAAAEAAPAGAESGTDAP